MGTNGDLPTRSSATSDASSTDTTYPADADGVAPRPRHDSTGHDSTSGDSTSGDGDRLVVVLDDDEHVAPTTPESEKLDHADLIRHRAREYDLAIVAEELRWGPVPQPEEIDTFADRANDVIHQTLESAFPGSTITQVTPVPEVLAEGNLEAAQSDLAQVENWKIWAKDKDGNYPVFEALFSAHTTGDSSTRAVQLVSTASARVTVDRVPLHVVYIQTWYQPTDRWGHVLPAPQTEGEPATTEQVVIVPVDVDTKEPDRTQRLMYFLAANGEMVRRDQGYDYAKYTPDAFLGREFKRWGLDLPKYEPSTETVILYEAPDAAATAAPGGDVDESIEITLGESKPLAGDSTGDESWDSLPAYNRDFRGAIHLGEGPQPERRSFWKRIFGAGE